MQSAISNQRQRNIENRTIFCGDNLDIFNGFNSNSIDLIYLDPPFNKKKQFIAPIGSSSEGASFKDYWGMEDIKDAWLALLQEEHPNLYHFIELSRHIGDPSNKYYLVYMAMRLMEMKRILKDTGSIYLHCDQTMSHYLKLLMDVIFGEHNFRNEIVWCYTGPSNTKRYFPRKHDNIFFYSKGESYFFDTNKIKKEYVKLETGTNKRGIFQGVNAILSNEGKVPEDYWTEQLDGMTPVGRKKSERIGYPTQKPLALLERIIKASCPEDGVVLDPFCGCATTCVAAEKLHRQWIGIDISKMAYQLVKDRLEREVTEKAFMVTPEIFYREDIPVRTDIQAVKLVGVYKQEVKEELYGKQHGDCAGCGQHFVIQIMEIDHKVPRAKGGQDNVGNLQLLCSYCNRVKGDRDMKYLKSRLDEVLKRKAS